MNARTSVADPQAFAKLRDLIKDILVAMLSTVAADGAIHSRPMATRQIESDGTLWFFATDDSLIVREINEEHQVNVSYAEPRDHRYVSVSGTATIVHDASKAAQLWHPSLTSYFPKGLGDPHLALLRIRIESAEYWDIATSRMVEVYRFARSLATGDPARPIGDHRRIDVQGFTSRK